MKRVLLGLFALICVGFVIAAFWYVRPGSEFSPREVMAMSDMEDRRLPYRTMDRIYPSSPIETTGPVTTFARAERNLSPRYEYEGERHDLEDYAERRSVQGIYVLKDGEVVMERYFGEADASDRFTSWSVAKSVISSLIGIGLKDGVIESLDDKAATYAPEYAGTDYGDTSIRHLLMMSSGIDFNENYEERGSDIRRLFFNTFLLNRDVDETVKSYGRERPAGEVFDYISSNTQVLTAVLRGAYDRPLIDLFEEKLAQPLGLSGGSWLTDRKGEGAKELGYCCLQLTLEDYAKLGQLYVQDGMLGDTRILPEGWMEFVRTPPQPSHEPKEDGGFGYGHHFWVTGGDEGAFSMQGYNGQFVHMDPEEGVVIVMVSADRNPWSAKPEFPHLFRAIKDELKS
ncbi:MAG: serine hydrolase [Parvularcula sp.]|nr:serine hydrolase [Parvularcula sp.]